MCNRKCLYTVLENEQNVLREPSCRNNETCLSYFPRTTRKSIWNEKPTRHYFIFIHISTDLYMFRAHRPIFRRVHTAVHTTIGSVSVPFWSRALYVVYIQSTRPERYRHWTNGCVNSCVNSPEDGPVGPKHVEIRRYMNKIEIVTYVGFSFHMININLLLWRGEKSNVSNTNTMGKIFYNLSRETNSHSSS